MRRALVIVLLVVVLVGLDAVFNDLRFSAAVYRELVEFGRVLTRTISGIF